MLLVEDAVGPPIMVSQSLAVIGNDRNDQVVHPPGGFETIQEPADLLIHIGDLEVIERA